MMYSLTVSLFIVTLAARDVFSSESYYHGPTAIPQVRHDGYLADTHEVAASKSKHFAAVDKAKTHLEYRRHHSGYSEDSGSFQGYSNHVAPYQGPVANPVVLKSGYLADTHEVATAKSAHLAALATQSHGHSYGESYGYSSDDEHSSSDGDLMYHGPTAIPQVLHNGHIADTHEVAVAKSAHLAALATQSHGHSYGESYGYSSDDEHSSSDGDLRYHGPTAIPHVLHDGHIPDTHEVAAAKIAHLAALATQSHGHSYGESYGYSSDDHSSSDGDLRYHGPTAIPHVLHDGHIADTHEVAAAKAEHFAAVGQDFSGRYAEGYDEYSGAYNEVQHASPYH